MRKRDTLAACPSACQGPGEDEKEGHARLHIRRERRRLVLQKHQHQRLVGQSMGNVRNEEGEEGRSGMRPQIVIIRAR